MLTQHISRKSAQNVFRAFDYAHAKGYTLNTQVVINLSDTTQRAANRTFMQIRHKYCDWLAHKRKKHGNKTDVHKPMWVSTFEDPTGNNPHVNWVLYVPPKLRAEFEKKLLQWVNRVQGLRKFDVDVTQITPGTHKSVAKYILKGIDPLFVGHFHLEEYYEGPQGEFWGRRASVSPTLNKEPRKVSGFNPRTRSLPIKIQDAA